MSAYLTFIGAMNLAGTLTLMAALSDRVADALLRRWTFIAKTDEPIRHGPYGRVWLWWAIVGTGFFGVLNLVAASWPEAQARVVLYGDLYTYGAFEVLAIGMSLSRRFGPGVVVCHVLWLVQGGWGLWVALR